MQDEDLEGMCCGSRTRLVELRGLFTCATALSAVRSTAACLTPVLADSETRRTAPLAADTHFVDVLQEVGRIFIDAIRAGTLEFVLAVAAGQETNAKGAGALRS
jgi:hypothetical protein